MKTPSYYAPYSNNAIYEFNPEFNINTGDLNAITTGYAVHKSKDVLFVLNITDKQSNVLTSEYSVTENPFIESINIDILNISGNIISGNYITGSFSNTFALTEAQNTGIFGSYSKDFGIEVYTVGFDANVHSTEYYVYGNPLEIMDISITDASGTWFNNTPIQQQSYIPYSIYESNINPIQVKNNALYLNEYQNTISGYYATISGSISFGILSGESLKIDWGNSQINTIFQQTGISGFVGIDGVTSIDADTGNNSLINLIYPTGVNGKTYNFSTGYLYPTGVTGIYDVNFYYSGIGSTGNELIKTIQYRIPDELKSQGKPQIPQTTPSGRIKFDITFLNDYLYTSFDTLDIYTSTGSGVAINTGNFNTTIPILTNEKNYSFYIEKDNINANTPYWFNIVPYSQIASGYSWIVGPYSIYQDPQLKSNISTESITLLNGDSSMNIELITGIITGSDTYIIDTIIKNDPHFAYEYLTRFDDYQNHYCASKIIMVDNTSGSDPSRTGLSFVESHISDNYFVLFNAYDDNDNIYLTVKHDYSQFSGIRDGLDLLSNYKLQKTSI